MAKKPLSSLVSDLYAVTCVNVPSLTARNNICTEELKAAYPSAELQYEVMAMSFAKNEQKEPWFLKVRSSCKNWANKHTLHVIITS